MTTTLTDAERAELLPEGRLRAGIAVGPAKSAMWAIANEAGEPEGITVELARAMAAWLGVPLELVVHASSGAIIAAAPTGAWDVAFTPVDAERKKHVLFGNDYFLGESTLLVREDSPIRAVADADRAEVRIVGVEGTATLRSARRALASATFTGTEGLDEAVAMLRDGRADAIGLGRESLQSLSATMPGWRILPDAFHAAGTAICVPLGHAQARAVAARFIEAAKADGTVRRAFDANGMGDSAVAPAGSLS